MSVGSSPDLYNILNTILQDTAPHSMSELYSISFTDGTSSVSSGTISLLSFQNKTINTGGTGGTYTYSSGFEWGYYNDNYHSGGYSGAQTWFSSRTPVYTHASPGRSRVTDFTNISTASSGQTSVNGDETYSYLWTGYFKAPITSTYYFNTRSDDNSHMWVGANALNPRYDNETVDNGGLHGMQTVTSSGVSLTGGVYYDFRMTFGEEGGGDDLQAQWRNNSTSFSYDWSTVAFSNRQISGGSSSGITLAFHYGTFTSSDYSSAYSTVSDAANAGHVYSNTPSGTYTWGTLGTPSSTSTSTTYTWTPTTTLTGKLLMVAGGGGGGGTIGGGGGAGGVVYSASASISASQKTIVVGNGGTGGQGWDYFPRPGSSGTNTSFTGFTTAIGGGGGAGHGVTSGDGPKSGGSGGGGAQAGTTGASGTAGPPRQGYDGGNSHNGADYAGGGGGAGGAGGTSGGSTGGIGGIGVDYSSDFTTTYGDSGWFASGGGGGVRDGNSRAGGSASIGGGGNGNNLDSGVYTAAQKHTGGGGGGGGFAGGGNFMAGGQGGSGIVIFSESSSSSGTTLAFHYGTFTSSDYSSAYSTVSDAANAGHVYSNTPSGTYTWGTLGTPSTTSNQTTYTWTPSGTITASVLMVAGGGAGAGWWHGGGGGAGGLVYYSNQSLSGSKTIKVGNGGYQNGGNQTSGAWSNGFNTEFTGLTTAVGGGKGGTDYSKPGPGSSGGSGGGATGYSNGSGGSGTSGQGNSGGNGRSGRLPNGYNVGGGGGGAGGAGSHEDNGGHGGVGVDYSSVFGTTYGDSGWFAGGAGGGGFGGQVGGNGGNGGGGNGSSGTGNAQAGQAHTGGGGGGEGDLSGTRARGGGSGIVLIKY